LFYFKTLFFLLLLNTIVFAEILSVENISTNIKMTLQTKLRGQNKNIVQNIYIRNGYNPVWVGEGNKQKMSQRISALKDPLFNYKNKAFDQKSIARLFYLLDNGNISQNKKVAVYGRLDVMLSNSFVRLIRFIVQGDVDWRLVQRKMKALKRSDDIKATWEMSYKSFPNANTVASVALKGNIYAYLNSLLPLERRYKKLVQLLKNYRVMKKFPKIPYTKKTFKLGDNNNRIELIKKRLQISGDYPKKAPINGKFDKQLRRAVITYQKRYLLKVTGQVSTSMTYYLNKPAQENIQAIITNLDKTKLYPRHFENEYVEVNIPDFNLRYYRNGRRVMKMGLVVGRIDRPTPLFHNAIRYMVLNPTWTIPNNLIKRDLIHVLHENPMYLKENNIHTFSGNKEVQMTYAMLAPYENNKRRVPYRFVQYPGDNNALGRVKFMFPNKYAVYLHDTDNKTLLTRRYKIYSSGCMRVEKPFDLMDTLLKHSSGNYSQNRIENIFATNKPTTIKLNRPIPVHILYFTVYEEDGLAYFKNDIYLYDQIIQESVEGHKRSIFTVPKKRMVTMKKAVVKRKPRR